MSPSAEASSKVPASASRTRPSRWVRTFAVYVGLIVLTSAAYANVASCEFVNFDDDVHVYENPHVRGGLTRENVVWAFGIHGPSQWHPLAWMSHQLDCELFGLRPRAHHLMNLALHTASTLLLFLALRWMTSAFWCSACVAAVFAVHPLNVESVAWVSERRNVLSAVCWMLALLAYYRYAVRGGLRRYLVVCFVFALGLMAKPMLVTFPCVLMLLDYWPLGRYAAFPLTAENLPMRLEPVPPRGTLFLVLEKVPLLGLSAASSVLSFLCQLHIGVVTTLDAIPLDLRMANAAVAYVIYLRKMCWPSDLTVFYPHPALENPNYRTAVIIPAAFSTLFLLAMTWWALRKSSQRPYVLVGWLWFLGVLVPMIGLVQVAEQQMADRYAYLSLVGIFIALVWLIADALRDRSTPRRILPVVTGMCVAALAIATFRQVTIWHDSVSLFEHAIALDPRLGWAHNNLGLELQKHGKTNEAMQQYREAIRIAPRHALGYYNLGITLYDQGRRDEAVPLLQESLRLNPLSASTLVRLGADLGAQGRMQDAIQYFERALKCDPENVTAHVDLGIALGRMGRPGEGLKHLALAVKLDPDDFEARSGYGLGLLAARQFADAESQFQAAVRLRPGAADILHALALTQIRQGKVEVGRKNLERASALRPRASPSQELPEKLVQPLPRPSSK